MVKATNETTTDICKFHRNYALSLSHNDTYFCLIPTSPIHANTCAEVTAFTPTTTHPPLQSRTQLLIQSQRQPHICLSRFATSVPVFVCRVHVCVVKRVCMVVSFFLSISVKKTANSSKQKKTEQQCLSLFWYYCCVCEYARQPPSHREREFHFSVFKSN